MAFGGYSINGYWQLFYWWILVPINGYYINGYQWIICYCILVVNMVIILMAIGG